MKKLSSMIALATFVSLAFLAQPASAQSYRYHPGGMQRQDAALVGGYNRGQFSWYGGGYDRASSPYAGGP